MCSSGVGFNPQVDGQRLTFDLFGLYNGVFAMKDLQTQTVWTHIGGEALRGPLSGARLEMVPLMHVTWDEWARLHPDTLVLSDDTRWKQAYRFRDIGRPGLGRSFVDSLLHWDDRLPESTLVLGVELAGAFVAYPLDVLNAFESVINVEIAGRPVVVWYSEEALSAAAYSRVVDGKTLEFAPLPGNRFSDTPTKSTWNLQGLAVSGPLEGTQLEYVPSFTTEWYGWAAFHPETIIHDYDLARVVIGSGSESPGRRRSIGR